MKIDGKVLAAARVSKDPVVERLLEFYEFVTGNSHYESYVAREVTLQRWNNDLIAQPVSILTSGTNTVTSIDEDGINEKEIAKEEAKKDKEVDRVLKFLEKQPTLLEGTEAIRVKLTGTEQEKLTKESRLKIKDIPL